MYLGIRLFFYGNIWPKYCLGKGGETVPHKISNMKGMYIFTVPTTSSRPSTKMSAFSFTYMRAP